MAAKEITCPRCKKQFAGTELGLCDDCKLELVSVVRDDPAATKIEIQPIAQAALLAWKPGEDLDEAVLRALKTEHPNDAAALLPAITKMIEMESQRRGETKETALRRLAATVPGPEITFRTSGGGSSPFTSTTITEKHVYKLNGRETALEDLPPEIRQAIERGHPKAERQLKIGCSAALVSMLCGLFHRNI
jgi:hypothetical protein